MTNPTTNYSPYFQALFLLQKWRTRHQRGNDPAPECLAKNIERLQSLSAGEIQELLLKVCTEQEYRENAFAGYPRRDKNLLLLELADGQHRMETHWPLTIAALDGLRFGTARGYWDCEEMHDACTRVYKQERFAPYRARFEDYLTEWATDPEQVITGDLGWRLGHDIYTLGRRRFLGTTVGAVTHKIPRHSWPEILLPSTRPLEELLLTINFRSEAELQKNIRQPDERGGLFGRTYQAGQRIFAVEVFIERIAVCAERIGMSVYARDLARIVFIQLFHYAVQLNESAADVSDVGNSRSHIFATEPFSELTAGLATWHALKRDPHLQLVFEKACVDQGATACTWQPLRNLSIDELRVFIWFQGNRAAQQEATQFLESFYARYPSFPRLPK